MTPQQKASEVLRTRFVWIDALIASYLRNTGYDISELELVEVLEKTEIRWFVRKRDVTQDPREGKQL